MGNTALRVSASELHPLINVIIYLFVCGHLCSSACLLVALSAHTLRCSSACPADRSGFRPARDGKESGVQKMYAGYQKVSKQASTWHGKERPGHSDECNYSVALLIPPDLVVPSLALARVLWLERSRTSWDVPEPSRNAFPVETPRGRPARARTRNTAIQ